MRSKRPSAPTPASFTQTSMRPNLSIAAWARRSTSSRLLTSVGQAIASTPLLRHSFASSSRSSPRRAASTSLAPWRPNSCAAPLPKPLEAPVMTTTFPRILASAMVIPPWKSSTKQCLFRLDAGVADRFTPNVVLLSDVGVELFDGRAFRIERLLEQALAHVRALDQRIQLAIQPLADVLRHARRSKHARPRRHRKFRKARFHDSRYLRHQRAAVGQRRDQRTQLAVAQERQHGRIRADHHLDVAADEIRDRRRLALV